MRHPIVLAVMLFLASATLAGPALAQDEEPLPPPPGPDTPITRLVPVPAGEFTMGRLGSEEMPAHRVRVAAFLLDEHEVTNEQYLAFCEATDHRLPVFWGLERFQCGEAWLDHPVIGVSAGDATAYAEWVGKRLPTEAEWEYAARGGGEGRYGGDRDELAPDEANYKKSPHDAPTKVMSYEPNAYGIYDMIGNVREWTSDRFGAEVPAASLVPESGELAGVTVLENPTGPEKGSVGVVKGGGWYSGPSCQAATVRNGYPRGWGDFAVGFRCARDAKSSD